MTILGNEAIAHARKIGLIKIEPWNEDNLQPGSYDVTLGNTFLVPNARSSLLQSCIPDMIDPLVDQLTYSVFKDTVTLFPGKFCLGVTQECIALPGDRENQIMAAYHGKSTIGRWGIASHITAGLIDRGFEGHITLELVNHGSSAVRLTGGILIGQLVFQKLIDCSISYHSNYSNESCIPIPPKNAKLNKNLL